MHPPVLALIILGEKMFLLNCYNCGNPVFTKCDNKFSDECHVCFIIRFIESQQFRGQHD
jgi:hypothetical protein